MPMTKQQALECAWVLRDKYFQVNAPYRRQDSVGVSSEHLAWMVDQMARLEFDEAKVNRWLGYIQGVLVTRRTVTLAEMKEASRAAIATTVG